jgi:hypothetical protein
VKKAIVSISMTEIEKSQLTASAAVLEIPVAQLIRQKLFGKAQTTLTAIREGADHE